MRPNFPAFWAVPDAFFSVWVNKTMHNSLGYPTEKAYTRSSAVTQNLNKLIFPIGILQVKDITQCYRTFITAEITKRGVSVTEWYKLGQRSLPCPGYTQPPPMLPSSPPPPPPPWKRNRMKVYMEEAASHGLIVSASGRKP